MTATEKESAAVGRTVFVTSEDPALDYTPALQFGDRIVGVFPPGQIHLHPRVALFRARAALREMKAGDYLALVGDPVKIGICAVVAAERVGKVNLLRWNRHTAEYVLIEVDFTEQSPAASAAAVMAAANG